MSRLLTAPAAALVCLFALCAFSPALAEPTLDVRPSVCPNLLNRDARTLFRVALVSDADFVAWRADFSTLELSRADGVGNPVTPVQRSRRPSTRARDVAAPANASMCSTFGVDGRRDLVLFFRQGAVTQAFELDGVVPNSTLDVCLSGRLRFSGREFNACDTVLITEFPDMTRPGIDDVGSLPRGVR